jgi:hypothetical protein
MRSRRSPAGRRGVGLDVKTVRAPDVFRRLGVPTLEPGEADEDAPMGADLSGVGERPESGRSTQSSDFCALA